MLLPRRSRFWAYVVALAGSGVTVGTPAVLGSGSGADLLTSMEFILSISAAGILGGWKPGLVGTATSLLAVMYLYLEPTRGEILSLAPYAVAGGTISFLCEGLHAVLRRLEERQRRLELEIADRRRAELSEQEHAERLRVTLASIGDAVITTDGQGRVTYLNAVAESLTGWKLSEAGGQPLEKVFRIVNEQTRQPMDDPVKAVLREGTLAGLRNHTILIARDGSERPIDDSAAPIRDKKGAIVGLVMTFRDVSERRRAERALQTAMLELKLVTESMSAMVCRCSRDLKYLWVSRFYADWVGQPAERIVGRPIVEIIGRRAFDQISPYFQRVLAGEEMRFEEELWLRERARWVSAAYTPTFDDTGEPDGWVAVVMDIDEKKRAEALLLEADRRKDEFLATLAHELRNPLAPICNSLQVFHLKDFVDKDLVIARETMDRQLRQMRHLVDDLLDVSRISHNTLTLRKERVELAKAVHNGIEAAQPLIDSSRHQLTVSLPEEPIYLDADATRLAQVMTNLLNNAAKYTDPGGRIELGVERTDNEAVIRVKDNGIGIPPEMLPRVFDMFSQADRSIERSRGGLGIGLTLVKRLVELHGGSIEARSAGPGTGSEFVVRLPAADAVEAEGSTPRRMESASPRQVSSRILVVDDNKDAADTLAKILRLMGGELQTVYDGLTAIEAAKEFRPEVMFLDIGLPELSGYEVCRMIRAEPWGQDVTMVALTGWGQDEDRKKSRAAGFDHHIVKPADQHEIMKVLNGRRREAVEG